MIYTRQENQNGLILNSDEDWSKLSDFDKYTITDAWAQEHIEIYWEERE